MSPLLVALITGVLGGGLVSAIASLINSRATARKVKSEQQALDAKLPAEIDSMIVMGAEQAVLTMSKALEAANARIAELERREDEHERTISELRREVVDLRSQIDKCQDRVVVLSDRLSAINPATD